MSIVGTNTIFIHDCLLVSYDGTLYRGEGKILFGDGIYTRFTDDCNSCYDETGCMV